MDNDLTMSSKYALIIFVRVVKVVCILTCDNCVNLRTCHFFLWRAIMKQDIKSEQYQAKLLGELFKSYGLNHVTPIPSETNYKLAVYLMKTKGEKNAKHLSK